MSFNIRVAAPIAIGTIASASWLLNKKNSQPQWKPFKDNKQLLKLRDSSLPQEKMDLNVPTEKTAVAIIACGSYSPPTLAHFRMMEDAKDVLEKKGFHVVGGFVSPVHMGYGKKSLCEMYHRLNMVGHALADSKWISCDPWECAQEEWTPTALVIERYSRDLDELQKSGTLNKKAIPLLSGGADLVDSFMAVNKDGSPVWDRGDVEKILSRGLICIAREGFDLDALVEKDDMLKKYKNNIHVVVPPIRNDISSTAIRRSLAQGKSIKYVVHDGVIDYVKENKLHLLPNWQ